jgi:tetratricopeptide (TPR) repeat protein
VRWAKFVSLIGALWLTTAATVHSGAQQPSPRESRRQSALAFEEEGKVAEAEAGWRSLLSGQPNDAEAYAHLGLLEARQEHYKEAIVLYQKALSLDPKMPSLRLNLGLSYFKAGNFSAAIQTFEPLLQKEPKSSPEALRLLTLLGLAHYGMGEYAAAIPYLKQATAADPANLPFRLSLAQSCLRTKQYQCVLDVYREILKTPDVYFGYGYLLWKALKFDEAEKAFRSELANNPEHPLALAYLGDTEIRLNHSEEALPNLERAVRLQPSIAIAHVDLGTIYEGRGRKDDAARELKTAEKLSPDDPSIHWRLGRFYQSIGQAAEAKAEFEKTRSMQRAKEQSLQEQMRQAEAIPAAQNTHPGPK